MQRDIAPVHITAALCTLHEPQTDDNRRCIDNTRWCTTSIAARDISSSRDSLMVTCTRTVAHRSTALQSPQPHGWPAFFQACPATCARRCQLHNSFSRAGRPGVQRAVDEEVDLGCTSTPELTCDAGTRKPLSAGVLGRFEELAQLLCTCSAATPQRELLKCSLLPIFCSLSFELSAPISRWFDDA